MTRSSLASRYVQASTVEAVKKAVEELQPFHKFMKEAADLQERYVRGEIPWYPLSPGGFVSVYNSAHGALVTLASGVIQLYKMSAGERKWVQWLLKKVRTNFRTAWGRYDRPSDLQKATKVLFEFKEALDVIFEVVAKGHLIEESSGLTYPAGGFTLVNTGGFSEEVMRVMQGELVKAEKLLRTSGFSQVCYGKILVTRDVGGSKNSLAHYRKATDDVFVRAGKEKFSKGALITFLHELGHRFDFKFLKDQKGKEDLFRSLQTQPAPRLKPPQIGDVAPAKGGKQVTVVEVSGDVVRFQDKEGITYRTTRKEWWDAVPDKKLQEHPVLEGFVTSYAATNSVENFAEMFAFYCAGDLPVNQAVAFEKLVFGLSFSGYGP